MSATDELRRLLDERGVKWHELVNVSNCVFTVYESPIFGDIAAMDNDGTLYFHELNGIDVTPEQAIAATLGSEYHGYEQAAIEAWESIKAWNTRAANDTLTAEQVRRCVRDECALWDEGACSVKKAMLALAGRAVER